MLPKFRITVITIKKTPIHIHVYAVLYSGQRVLESCLTAPIINVFAKQKENIQNSVLMYYFQC